MSSPSIIGGQQRRGTELSFVCPAVVAARRLKTQKAPLARAPFCLLLGIAYGITAAVTPVCDGQSRLESPQVPQSAL